MSLDVLSCVARPVFLLLIYADCDRNTASFPVSRQNASKILRDNLFNIALAAHWHGNKQSSDHDCKNFRSIYRAIFTAPPVFAMLLQQSAKQHFWEALR